MVHAVGPIQGVAPPVTGNPSQKHMTQGESAPILPLAIIDTYPGGTSGQVRRPVASQSPIMQGSNAGASLSQPQARNVVKPQQPISHAQGHQRVRFRTPMTTSSQQGQAGNDTPGSVGVGPGRGVPSFEPGAGVSQHANNRL